MEKEVVYCKDCMYKRSDLCPMKSDWQNRDYGFCDVGEQMPPFITGVLFGSEDATVYLLIIKVEEDAYGKGRHRYSCIDTLHELPTFMTETDLAAYKPLGRFPLKTKDDILKGE